jgi:uncharacterized damage-inducible protein DinB
MKEMFLAFSRYNQKANAVVFSYIEKMTTDQLKSPIKAFYKTIGENVFHVIKSDIKWLVRLSKFQQTRIVNEDLNNFIENNEFSMQRFCENLNAFINLRKEIDKEIVLLIECIDENSYMKDLEIPFGKGTIVKPLWKLLFQWFNHHTHHRGQMSIQLENVGIENDYSLVLDKIDG